MFSGVRQAGLDMIVHGVIRDPGSHLQNHLMVQDDSWHSKY